MDEGESGPKSSEVAALRVVFFVGVAVVLVGIVVAFSMPNRVGPPPEEIADDPVLVQGRELYMTRCISCHGERGRGDGPIVDSIGPAKPTSFLERVWKHGERPEEVLNVIRRGVPGTDMAGWEGTYSERELRAVAAYIYHLGGREIPDELKSDLER